MEEKGFNAGIIGALKAISTRKGILFSFLGFFIFLTFVYSNHFDNGFHFDDTHTIVNNAYIRDLKNIPLFFKDAGTVSSLPANQSWRPLMPFLYAIDYKIGGGLDPFAFHVSTFLWYLLQLVVMYFLFLKIFRLSCYCRWPELLSFFAVVWYGTHTANAETINYVSARSDSISTALLIISLFMFVKSPLMRKYGFYLIPLVFGAMVKQAVLVYPGLLFFYVWFFEYERSIADLFRFKKYFTEVRNVILVTIPALVVCAIMYFLQARLTPETFTPGGESVNKYLITQPYVILHYFRTFFLPTSLSADTDWRTLENVFHWKFVSGLLFLGSIAWIIISASAKKAHKPIAFGLIWFILALLPTSSFIPFAEVMNDHRIFFPFVGLLLAVVSALYLVLTNIKSRFFIRNRYAITIGFTFFLIVAHAYGTYQRNKVWNDGESLWYDVTVKSPANGRGLMNYGLTQMEKGNYAVAEKYFAAGLKQWPYYSYLYINMAILKNAVGDKVVAEENFKKGLQYGNDVPGHHYFYAYYLDKEGRKEEAVSHLVNVIKLAPAHTDARYMLMRLYNELYEWDKLQALALGTLSIIPDDALAIQYLQKSKIRKTKSDELKETLALKPSAKGFLELSLYYYREGKFEDCISASEKALELNPLMAEAYNNICSAYNQLGKWNEAESACKKALEIKPDFVLAQNNLKSVYSRRANLESAVVKIKENKSAEAFLNLSLEYYRAGFYDKCIEACYEALKIKPDYAEAYNNICSSYNQLRKWDLAIEACNKALKIKPDYELARNNLQVSKNGKGI